MRKQVRSKLMDTAHAQQADPVQRFALEYLHLVGAVAARVTSRKLICPTG